MIYSYICPNCKEKMSVNIKHEQVKYFKQTCCKCNTIMRRDWKTGITIADGDKAEDIQSTSFIKERLKNRPSGKTQIYY